MQWIVVAGAGRSGTAFLASLLSHSENAIAFHERLGNRLFGCLSYYDPEHPFILSEIDRFVVEMDSRFPGDRPVVSVNPNAVFAIGAIRKRCPNVKVFHLVRDGRDVVASNWTRKIYTQHERAIPLLPKDPREFHWFQTASRFEKLAWHWKTNISAMTAANAPVIHFERIIESFDYLRSAFLSSAGIDLRDKIWLALHSNRVNQTKFRLVDFLRGRPTLFAWTEERRQQFDDICRAPMTQLGYRMDKGQF